MSTKISDTTTKKNRVAVAADKQQVPAVVQAGGDAAAAKKLQGRILLVVVAILYGTLNVSLRQLYTMPNPPTAPALSCCRGWLTMLCFLPALLQKDDSSSSSSSSCKKQNNKTPLWVKALEFAFWNCGSFALLNVGLQKTGSATRASFLTQTSVVITPLISLLAGHEVGRSVWLGCATALAGLVTLSMGSGGGGVVEETSTTSLLSTGDLLVLAGAFCWSAYLFRCSTLGNDYPEVKLQALLAAFRAVLYSFWFLISAFSSETLLEQWPGYTSLKAWIIMIFSSMGPGALASVLLQVGQKEVSASEANVILCGEPVFTALCAWLVLGEVTLAHENLGGMLILLAALLASGAFDGILYRQKQKEE